MKKYLHSNKLVLQGLMPVALILALSAGNVFSQPAPPDTAVRRENAVRIFIDCSRCDINYIRDEIPYVNYVRDVREAQVYIQETMDITGSGGRKYTFAFVGQQDFLGINDTLFYMSRPDDPMDFTRTGRTQMMKMGLMPYVARSPLFAEVEITASDRIEKQEVIDRWNNWVFELQFEPDFEGEETLRELQLDNSVSASRITKDWKIELFVNNRLSRTKYSFDDTLYTQNLSSQRFDNLIVKSIGENWAAGLRTDVRSSTYSNSRFRLDVFPSVEYNIFPYAESTHRQLRILYGLGGSFNVYIDTTVFDQIRENRMQQKLQLAYQVQQKWGSINVSLEGSNYFHDVSKSRVELDGFIQVRIIKGLSVRIFGGVARINDQLNLARGDLSEADILLQLQELQTSYQLDGRLGITYTFGSIYNNVVNPRFGNGRRRFF